MRGPANFPIFFIVKRFFTKTSEAKLCTYASAYESLDGVFSSRRSLFLFPLFYFFGLLCPPGVFLTDLEKGGVARGGEEERETRRKEDGSLVGHEEDVWSVEDGGRRRHRERRKKFTKEREDANEEDETRGNHSHHHPHQTHVYGAKRTEGD